MEKFKKKLVKIIYERLGKIIKSWEPVAQEQNDSLPFHSLSPIDDANVAEYITALNWALENRDKETIHNIALTGPYGSGKSSILYTFREQNTNSDYVFLELSLATFKEELISPNEDKDGHQAETPPPRQLRRDSAVKKNEDILRLIEFSILQQIFYHEDDSKIPDSRFKKIKSIKRRERVRLTAYIIAAALFALYLFLPDVVEKTLRVTFPNTVASIVHFLALIVFLAAVVVVVFRSIRLMYSVRISKLKIKEAEIEIDKGISKSILNNHLDEILYFFEVTGYSVVFIEDLDRFRQAEIFTKLRELNLLINKSKKVEQTVVFVYAVRDELFKDKDRTKFFDFIIPVIPVINASNSNDKLSKLITDSHFPVSASLIEDVSLFIDDMRLLYNIVNEYYIYRELLDKQLPQDKLFAMIVYKNIHPDDFVKLSEGKGVLYGLLRSRYKYITTAIERLNQNIEVRQAEIQKIANIHIKDLHELRQLYLLQYVQKAEGFANFTINGTDHGLADVSANEELFAYAEADQLTANFFNQYSQNITKKNVKFSVIEKEVDAGQTFQQRLALIEGFRDDRTETLKKEIVALENEKTLIRHLKLQQLLADPETKLEIDTSTRQGQLLRLLLRYGYIDENYLDYISLFYPGSLTKEDRTFLLNVKSEIASDYDFGLTQIGNLVTKIREIDFRQPYTLNYDLLDYLLVSGIYKEPLAAVIGQLDDQHAGAPAFIDGFISNGTNLEPFIKALAARWPSVWKYISEVSDLVVDRKEVYLKLILAHTAIADLVIVADHSDLRSLAEDRPDFLSIIPTQQRLKEVIRALDLRFKELNLEDAPKAMVEYIYKNDYYAISPHMLSRIVRYFGKLDQPAFDSKNYNALLNSGCQQLVAYVESQIDTYVTAVYLELPFNLKEPEGTLAQLLNNKAIALDNRIKIIEQTDTRISKLTDITASEVEGPLLEHSRVLPDWTNLVEYYQHYGPENTPELISFLNRPANAEALGRQAAAADDSNLAALLLAVITENKVDDAQYAMLLAAVPDRYDMEQLPGLEEGKMKLLVEKNLLNPSTVNFFKLNDDYPGLHLLFLEVIKETFLAAIPEYRLDAVDVLFILNSQQFSPREKLKVVEAVEQEVIIDDSAVLAKIARLILDHAVFKVSKEILMAVLKEGLPVMLRVQLFNMHFRDFDMADIVPVFETFPDPYNDIGVRFTSPVIPEETENRYLANNLKARDFIASIKPDKKGIKLVNFKK